MNYEYIDKQSDKTFVLLHGTGGNLDDLQSIATYIDDHANILMLEGDVLEYGQRRFFKRYMDGSYDLDDLDKRAKKLETHLKKWSKHHGFSLDKTTFIGYSNGANLVIYSYLNLTPSVKQLIAFHGMTKNMPHQLTDATDLKVFYTIGMYDPLTTYKASQDSLKLFKVRGIQLTKLVTHQGHQIIEEELGEAKKWYIENSQS